MTIHPISNGTDDEPLGLDSLTAAETAMAETKAAQSIATLGDKAYPQTKLLGALGWVLHRRTDQRITFEAYMGSRKLDDIVKELGLADDDETDEADGEEAGKDDDEATSPE